MFCRKCQKQITQLDLRCPNCGASQEQLPLNQKTALELDSPNKKFWFNCCLITFIIALVIFSVIAAQLSQLLKSPW